MNPILFGRDNEEHIVAVQQLNDTTVRIYKRNSNTISYEDKPFFPYFHLSHKQLIETFSKKFWLKKLEGNNFYQYLCVFPSLSLLWDGIHHTIEKINFKQEQQIRSYTETEHILFRPDINTQYLMQSGKALFKEMQFSDVYRMQLDIETYSKNYRFSNASRIDDRIILIALSDNRGWETVLGNTTISEKELLQQCVKIIQEKNPDVLEGHNIYNFDLPYILKRCELLSIEFSIGRDGSSPRGFKATTSFAEQEIEYTNYEIAGRHIIDTWLLVQSYDMTKRAMESHSLKYAAQYFGVASPERTYISGEKISWYWDNEPATLKKYALNDVQETRGISEKLSMSSFYLTQMLPYNYGTVARLGAAAKIESLLLREYLHHRHSIPKPEKGTQTTGGYTDIFYTGVFGPIIHADVESLYPSIMISKKISPATDTLQIFQTSLQHLTTLRLETKRAMKKEKNQFEKISLDALQSSFKILINSFYGYLGYYRALFSDYKQADVVTTTGQRLLKKLMEKIIEENGQIIEVDTDGIFFVPPSHINDEQKENEFITALSQTLPEGISLGIDGRYQKMLSYKKKNYTLLTYENTIKIKGSSLISRSIEKFGRNYIQQCIEYLLHNKIEKLHQLYLETAQLIQEHKLEIKDFARTEKLKDSLTDYLRDIEQQTRNRTASYELALQTSRNYKIGDSISFYFTGNDANITGFKNAKEAQEWDKNFPDENIPYYMKRLEEFSEKFSLFFSEKDFRAIFSSEDLFGFDATNINILNNQLSQNDSIVPLSIDLDT